MGRPGTQQYMAIFNDYIPANPQQVIQDALGGRVHVISVERAENDVFRVYVGRELNSAYRRKLQDCGISIQ